MNNEDRQALLRLDWENFRYQDGLRWSRIQVVGIVEAAILTGSFAHYPDRDVSYLMKFIFAFILSLIAAVVCALAEKDGRDSQAHAQRASMLEKALYLPKLPQSKRVLGVRGHHTMRIAMFLVLGLDALILFNLAQHVWDHSTKVKTTIHALHFGKSHGVSKSTTNDYRLIYRMRTALREAEIEAEPVNPLRVASQCALSRSFTVPREAMDLRLNPPLDLNVVNFIHWAFGPG